jgi:flagellar biosynthetic protein FliO
MAELWSTTIALVVVCALAVAALKLLGRRSSRPGRGLRVVEELSLGARRSVFVIEAAGRCFLVGAGDGPLNVLAELDAAAVRGETEATTSLPVGARGVFTKALERVLLGAKGNAK